MINKINYIFALGVALLATFSLGQAQMSVTNSTPYNSSAYLLQSVFMGSNINAFNFEYNGSSTASVTNQVGYFTGGGNIFGIDSGIVMSTGNINSIPNNGFASASFNGNGDADVLQVAQSVGWGTPPSVMRDRAILEFDFVAPQGDSVAFEYCFGSEEWPNYPCSQFNDAFGFFISGPGLNGAYSNNAVNVSLVPGTTSLPVAITSIHAGTGWGVCVNNPSYAQYYNNGPTSNAFTFADLNNGNAYGAWTDVFQTRPVWVQACDTYHVKMAICDGVDRVWDSAVFLKAKSFEFFGISVNPQPSYNPWGFDSALYEGCGNLALYFTRSDSTYPPYTLQYSIAGTATMGADYEIVPGCTLINGVYECEITFPQDSITVGYDIEIYYDQLNEVYETFDFIVTDSNVSMCGESDTLALTIIDQPVLQTSGYGNTTLDCNDSAALIGVNVTNGLPPFTYTWSNAATTDSFQYVQPTVTSSYVVQIEDGCGFQSATEVITVGVFNVPWAVVKIGDEQTVNCTDSPVDIAVAVEFNDQIWHGDISYLWGDGTTDSTISVFSLVDTTYSVTITRGCTGESVVKTFNLYTENDPVVTFTEDTKVEEIACPGDPIEIKVSASGGYPPYTFAWDNGSPDSTTVVAPLLSRYYYVTVNDICGLVDYVDSVYVNVPIADPLVIRGVQNDTLACAQMKAHFGPAQASGGFGWGYELTWTDFASNEDYIQQIIYEDKPFTVKLTDGCHADTAEKTVWAIIAKKNDLDLTVTNDTVICSGDQIILEAKGIDGGGDYRYFWENSPQATGKLHSITPKESGIYDVRVEDMCDTVRMASIRVDVSDVTADFEYEYINDYEVVFHNKSWSTDSIQYYDWNIAEAGIASIEQSPVIVLPDGNAYEVELISTNEHTCKDIALVLVKPEYHLYIPNSFSPNDDGNNETWKIESLGIRELRLEVYDRWGNKLYTTTDKDFEWDGKVGGERVPMGAYTWRIVLYTDNDDYVKREGTLLLLNDFQSR
jgi:gliding motility-associated-like protein